jgi:hypothetical protein
MLKIKQFILMAFLCVLSISCSKRWCSSHYPLIAENNVIIWDSIRIITKDTTLFVYLPGSSTVDSVAIPCPDIKPSYIADTAHATTELAEAWAWLHNSHIQLKLVQTDTTLLIRLANALKETEHWHNEFNKVNTIEKVKYIPGFYKFCTFTFIGAIATLLLILFLKLRKG